MKGGLEREPLEGVGVLLRRVELELVLAAVLREVHRDVGSLEQRRRVLPIVGLNYKDRPEAGKAWLKQFGDPYLLSVVDTEGKTGIDFGVYGVPETFVIVKQGTIRFKQIGPVTPEALRDKIEPLLKQLQAENAAANPA